MGFNKIIKPNRNNTTKWAILDIKIKQLEDKNPSPTNTPIADDYSKDFQSTTKGFSH